MNNFLFHFLIILSFSALKSNSQQAYSGLSIFPCNATDVNGPSPDFLYTCNGQNRSCKSFMIFRSNSPYNTIANISKLMSANLSEVIRINNISSGNTVLPEYKEVIVPVTCSCSKRYYESNTSYTIRNGSNVYDIVFETFQSLTTCDIIKKVNVIDVYNLTVGSALRVPLRCACPTNEQISKGSRFLVTYVPMNDDSVSKLGENFNITSQDIVSANELPDENQLVHPLTTILIPLPNEPLSSQTKIRPPSVDESLPTPPQNPNRPKRAWLLVLVWIVGGLALLSVTGTTIFFLFFRRNKIHHTSNGAEKQTDEKLEAEAEFLNDIYRIIKSLKVYTFEELQLATGNFRRNGLINQSSVYRGTINGDLAAIKKMNGDVTEELKLLDKINHSNLIQLLGFCLDKGNWYLVYKYAQNGPLSNWIYSKKTEQQFLNWKQRIQIALDVANGISYLHSYTSAPCIHRNLNASNVLLNSEFRAIISNFSLARSAEGQEGPYELTRHIIGTKGYMAPEYLENGLITTKLDVYSFGVLMMEILTGQKVEVFQKDLSEILSTMILSEFIDPSLQEDYPQDQALFVVKLIRICLNKDPSHRPDMNEVVLNLARILDIVPLTMPDMKRVHPTASSDLIMEDEIAKLRAEMENERVRHKQELEQERSQYNKSKEQLFIIMQKAGISVPDDIDLEVK